MGARYNRRTLKSLLHSVSRHLQSGWVRPRLANRLLLPLSWLYCLSATLHRLSWRTPLRAPLAVDVPVLVVGNVTVGGTGKTPLVLAITEYLLGIGRKPGIVSRGYGGGGGHRPHLVGLEDSPHRVGDEPLLMKRRSVCPVAICSDRFAAARLLVERELCDVIVCDDGMQHHRLRRNVDIVVIDGERGLGNGWCLPSGPLREPASAVYRADFCVINGADSSGWVRREGTANYSMSVHGDEVSALGDAARRKALSQLTGVVHAVAGLGNPERFFGALERAGLETVVHPFPDHHPFTEDDFSFADEHSTIVMTEKDATKCASLDIPGEIWVLPITGVLDPGLFPCRRWGTFVLPPEQTSRGR